MENSTRLFISYFIVEAFFIWQRIIDLSVDYLELKLFIVKVLLINKKLFKKAMDLVTNLIKLFII